MRKYKKQFFQEKSRFSIYNVQNSSCKCYTTSMRSFWFNICHSKKCRFRLQTCDRLIFNKNVYKCQIISILIQKKHRKKIIRIHSPQCKMFIGHVIQILRALCCGSLLTAVTLSNAFLFFIFFFSHCFCTALFLLNHILFITIDWIQWHFCPKKRSFATTSTQDDTLEVCYSRYQPIGATFRGTIYSNTNYTVYFRPVRCNMLIVSGLYLVCIFPFFDCHGFGYHVFGCHGLHSFNLLLLSFSWYCAFVSLHYCDFFFPPFSARNYFSVAAPQCYDVSFDALYRWQCCSIVE